ncbi:UvrB/UvrC motif-containing protein [Salinimicrobium sp. WS361]|uniref:UvrB/UvrC motif-containing protein n=1 Tax=Salinimicrobium sp. WS361 TaxID=3425123 RepID=UPI003D6E9875
MSSPLHVVLSTGSAEAKLFFGVAQHAAEFVESNYERRRRFRPSFIIYQETLYTHPLVRFKVGDAEDCFFRCYEELSNEEFDCLFYMILEENEAFEKTKDLAKKAADSSDHMADAMAYTIRAHMQNPLAVSGLEKRLIDNLNIPGLETALREAVKRENFEAAAYIRDRVMEQGHIIFDDGGRLIVRLPQSAARQTH